MASALVFTVVTTPKQFTNDALEKKYTDKYRELRLQSLKSDPAAFSSTFKSESKQPFGFWTGRMSNPRTRHFVAFKRNMDLDDAVISDYHRAVLEAQWVGTLVLLGPVTVANGEGMPLESFARGASVEDRTGTNSNSALSGYHLAGFYVAPEARGRGLGTSLVNAAFEAIAQDWQKMHNTGAICTVGTSHQNSVVRRLFQRMGFLEVAEEVCDTIDGRRLTEIVMRRGFLRQHEILPVLRSPKPANLPIALAQ